MMKTDLLALNYRNPEISPACEASELDEERKERNKQLVESWADKLYDADATTIMQWAARYAGRLAVTLSMENTVLAELAAQHVPNADFVFLDTEYHFAETLGVARQVEKRYPNRLVTARAVLSKEEQDRIYGPQLYRRDAMACCRMRKVEPLVVALGDYDAWVTGLRRADGPTRADAPSISLDQAGRLKISPLVTWTLDDTEDFIAHNDLIVHPLTRQGYPSIGCATCTLPVERGSDPRSGRWSGQTKTECGLHT